MQNNPSAGLEPDPRNASLVTTHAGRQPLESAAIGFERPRGISSHHHGAGTTGPGDKQ